MTMLIDYLRELRAGSKAAVDSIHLPDYFATALSNAVKKSESIGKEIGAPIRWTNDADIIRAGSLSIGLPTSVNIPIPDDPAWVGKFHTHPTLSIGHKGGYAAHSMLDLMTFADTKVRDCFFQFVASGPRTYLMVQVKGLSTFDPSALEFLDNLNKVEEVEKEKVFPRKEFDARVRKHQATLLKEGKARPFVKNPQGPDDYNYDMDYDLLDSWTTELKLASNIGAVMEPLSIKHCIAFAQRFTYAFYQGEGEAMSRRA
jgi:hypothetical protein